MKKASCKPPADCQILWEDTEAREQFFNESNEKPKETENQASKITISALSVLVYSLL